MGCLLLEPSIRIGKSIIVGGNLMTNFEYGIKKMPSFRAMGLKCDVPFTEVEAIKDVIHGSVRRASEFKYALNLDVRLGLSYHIRPDGFVYYSAYEVKKSNSFLMICSKLIFPK